MVRDGATWPWWRASRSGDRRPPASPRAGLRDPDAVDSVGHVWRSRWDSLRLFIPAQYASPPGLAYPAPRDTYPTKDQVSDHLQSYAETFDLPVRLNTNVTALRRGLDHEGYVLATDMEAPEALRRAASSRNHGLAGQLALLAGAKGTIRKAVAFTDPATTAIGSGQDHFRPRLLRRHAEPDQTQRLWNGDLCGRIRTGHLARLELSLEA